jgi:succinate-semialdehyde dehydrogenase/glutarate-semialdehyde dehydrogenase
MFPPDATTRTAYALVERGMTGRVAYSRLMLYIGGEWRPAQGGREWPATNPATGEVLGQVADGTAEDARSAVDAATAAFPGWSARTAYERAAVLVEAHRLMLERREDLARLMTSEQGKPLRMARNEVGYAADFLLWFAEEAKRVYGETSASSCSASRSAWPPPSRRGTTRSR